MIHSCHLLPDCSLRLAGLKGSPPLTPAADQAVFLEALAGKLSTVNVPFTQRFGRFLLLLLQWRPPCLDLIKNRLLSYFALHSP